MDDFCCPGPAISPSCELVSSDLQERLDHRGLGLKEVGNWEGYFEHDNRGDWGHVWAMQESEEQENVGDLPMRESTMELSTECLTSVTDGTRASSGSPPSEIASMSPTGTSTSMDHEWVCEQNGCGKSFSNRDKLR